jgi:hypothetical protein
MKSTIRAHSAALALLLPMTLAAFPAAAQEYHARREAQPQLRAVTLRADRGLAPGSTLSLEMRATPRAQSAEVRLGDSGIVVRLREETPGTYVGSYTVQRRDRIDPGEQLQARASYGDRDYVRSFDYPPRLQAQDDRGRDRAGRDHDRDRENGRDHGRDTRGPIVQDVSPADGARVLEHPMRLVARFSDKGSAVDLGSVRLRIDGRDVTKAARVSPQQIVIDGDLPSGRHTAELSLRDRAGNGTSRTWSFEVADAPRARAVPVPAPSARATPAAPLVLQVTSHADDAVVDARGKLTLSGRTAALATVQVHVDALATMGGGFAMTIPIGDATVQADREGKFVAVIKPHGLPALPNLRYDVRLTATLAGQTAEQRVTLRQREG